MLCFPNSPAKGSRRSFSLYEMGIWLLLLKLVERIKLGKCFLDYTSVIVSISTRPLPGKGSVQYLQVNNTITDTSHAGPNQTASETLLHLFFSHYLTFAFYLYTLFWRLNVRDFLGGPVVKTEFPVLWCRFDPTCNAAKKKKKTMLFLSFPHYRGLPR